MFGLWLVNMLRAQPVLRRWHRMRSAGWMPTFAVDEHFDVVTRRGEAYCRERGVRVVG